MDDDDHELGFDITADEETVRISFTTTNAQIIIFLDPRDAHQLSRSLTNVANAVQGEDDGTD